MEWKGRNRKSRRPELVIPVTDFVAGATVPGRNARYLRFQMLSSNQKKKQQLQLCQIIVWGKD